MTHTKQSPEERARELAVQHFKMFESHRGIVVKELATLITKADQTDNLIEKNDNQRKIIEQLKTKADALDFIRESMGYVQNGTGQTVKLFQDDATNSYFFVSGDRSYFADSFISAITEATKGREK